MGWLRGVLLAYGIINIAMGLEAFLAKGSVISLVAAGASGLIIIALAAYSKTNPKVGFGGAALVTLLLVGRFIGPAIKDQKFYPAIVSVALGLVVLACLIVGHLMTPRANSADRQS